MRDEQSPRVIYAVVCYILEKIVVVAAYGDVHCKLSSAIESQQLHQMPCSTALQHFNVYPHASQTLCILLIATDDDAFYSFVTVTAS